MKIPRYVVINKKVGETPLEAAEAWRQSKNLPADIPLAYAGRLDPLASGKLLVLIGDECKVQERYHSFDKTYEFSVLCGVASDTGDVMGRLHGTTYPQTIVTKKVIQPVLTSFVGALELPYPVFSAKTVQGKPLHTWAMEGRLSEITIPTKTSTVYKLTLQRIEEKSRVAIYHEALKKINSIPPVTEARKALGNDFRRTDVRADWEIFRHAGNAADRFSIIHLSCTASSGTYMRSLAEAIGKELGIQSLAYHIHRTEIGRYHPLFASYGLWSKRF
jgi:tRNA pseudouridine(55) synthase